MSRSSQSEERFPLLLLFLEDGQRSAKQNKKILIDKGRYQGIASGASTVITQWPGHIASCWIAAILVGVSIIIVSMLMLAFSIHPGINNLTAQCKSHKVFKTNKSATIHLAHGPSPWNKKQVNILEQIAQNYPQSQIELIMIQNTLDLLPKVNDAHYMYSTVEYHPEKIIRKREAEKVKLDVTTTNKTAAATAQSLVTNNTVKEYDPFLPESKKNIEFDIKIGSKRLFDIIFPKPLERFLNIKTKPFRKRAYEKPKTVQDVLKAFPKIKLVNSTYEKIFKNTPLYLTWHNMNEETRLFAIRVLQLWNYGGIAFSLNEISEPLGKFNSNKSAVPSKGTIDSDIKNMITVGISNYKSLALGLVTVDDEGFHMETKTPCHAFLGEILIELKKSNISTKSSAIIKRTLHRFCLKGAVDASYCKTVNG